MPQIAPKQPKTGKIMSNQALANIYPADAAIKNEAAFETHRRSFIKGAVASGFALGCYPVWAQASGGASSSGGAPASAVLKPTQQPEAFVKIDPDGSVTITTNRLDFGQGVTTALPMLLADEMGADWSKVKSIHGTSDMAYADPLYGLHLTGGSNSMKNSFLQYRELGARTRAMLVAAAAAKWNVSAADVAADNGFVTGPGGKKAGFGELAEAAMQQPVPAQVSLKAAKDFKFIGKGTRSLSGLAKASGQQRYGMDMNLPGQLTALVARPPVFGAKLKTLDDSAARKIAGVKAVLRVPTDRGGEGVAVLATGYWPALQARRALKAEWDTASVGRADSDVLRVQYQTLAQTTGRIKIAGDVSRLEGAAKKIIAEYSFPYLAHAPMEPLNCTIDFDGKSATVFAGSQLPGADAAAVARTLGLDAKAVSLQVQMAGGGFGRRAVPSGDYIVEAAGVVKAARAAGINVPIKTVWSREDDIQGGYYRPAHLHRAEIALDAAGNITAWDHVIVGQSILKGTPFEGFGYKDGIDNLSVEGMKAPYDVPMRVSVHHPEVNVPVLWWRSVGSTHTAYVMETLLDEVARASGQDPVALRMKLIGDKHPRHKAALQLAVDQSGYGKRPLAAGRAWGVAVHESFQSVVAMVAEASVSQGTPKLHAVTVGVHCNLAVNPLNVEAQVQGAVVMGLGMCLPGAAITLKDGVVQQSNFGDYPVPRITDMPRIAVHIVPSSEPPTGMGEPGLPPLAPAFANAIAKLTGKTPRELPFKLA
ncbi:MAG: molybdopterin cofactor-binding domain-containing protein [Burkholderiaceae bacterium]